MSRKAQKKQQIVSKTIQTVKAKQKNTKSEQENLKISGLADVLKNRQMKLKLNVQLDIVPDLRSDPIGDDRSWTWSESVNLYQRTIQGQPIKDNDKNFYLPNKLFGWQFFLTKNGVHPADEIYKYFINRMIVATFRKISRSQKLNDSSIDKLMKCIVTFSNLAKLLNFEESKLVSNFIDGIKYDFASFIELKEPDLLKSFVSEFVSLTFVWSNSYWFGYSIVTKDYDYCSVESLIKKEINQLRVDAIETLYNCALDNKSILTESRIKQFKECLKDDQLRNISFKIICLIESDDLFDYREFFETCLTELKNNSNVEQSVNYILDQSKDKKRRKELFDPSVLNDLFSLIESKYFESKIKEYLLEMIANYVGHDTTYNLSNEHQTRLIGLLESRDSTDHVKSTSVLILLSSSEKFKILPEFISNKLVENIGLNLDSNQSNLVLICLSEILNESSYLRETKYLEKISSKLSDQEVIVEKDGKIIFEKRTEENSLCTSVAYLAIKILYLSIMKQTRLNDKILNEIKSGLAYDNDTNKNTISQVFI